MKTGSLSCGAWTALLMFAASPVLGQRVQFPSAIPMNTAPATTQGTGYGQAPGYGTATPPSSGAWSSPSYGTAPTSPSAASPGYGTSTAPNYGTAPSSPPATSPNYGTGAAPGYGAATTPSYGPGATPTYGPPATPGPTATFQGTIQPPPTWDPYAPPGTAPAPIFPQDPTLPPLPGQPPDTITTMTRFLQEIRLDYLWMPGSSSKEFGINDVGLSATFAIPFLCNPKTPLLVTPGFTIHYWDGPARWDPPVGSILPQDIPPRVYDAYLNGAWNPQFSPAIGAELAFRAGVYSDFEKVVEDSVRFQGYGLGVISFSPSLQLKAGAVYLDRRRLKLLPAGGVVWTPNPDVRFEILFPNPKLAMRLPGYGSCEWWLYARGEYGGGSWTLRELPPVNLVQLDYNDIRVALGLDFTTIRELTGLVEVGIAFERELYVTKADRFSLNPTVFVGAGLAY